MVVSGFGMVIQNFPLCFTLYSVPCTVALVSESAALLAMKYSSNRSHFVKVMDNCPENEPVKCHTICLETSGKA